MIRFVLSLLVFMGFYSNAYASLAIDPHAAASNGGTTVTLTTTDTNDIIILEGLGSTSGATVSSVSDTAGLTWTCPAGKSVSNGNQTISYCWAFSSGALTSDVITPTMSSGAVSRCTAFGVNGADTTTPFDTNGALPGKQANASSQSASVTISTSCTNTFLFAWVDGANALSTVTRPTSFTQIVATGSFQDTSYLIVSSTQSSVAESYSWTGTAGKNSMIVDAIRAASCASSSALNDPLWFGMNF